MVDESFKILCRLVQKQQITYDEAYELFGDYFGKRKGNSFVADYGYCKKCDTPKGNTKTCGKPYGEYECCTISTATTLND